MNISYLVILFSIIILFGLTSPVWAASSATVKVVSGASTPGCDESGGCYVPSSVSVNVGGTVLFSNTDSAGHTFTAGTPSDGPSGEFDSGLVMAGQTYQVTLENEGTVNYFCMLHPWMTGQIKVANSPTYTKPITITISTDRSSYKTGDTIKVYGSVSSFITNAQLSILIFNPEGNLVSLKSPDLRSDKSYSTTLISGGTLWAKSGTYTINAQYGTNGPSTETTFYLAAQQSTQTPSTVPSNIRADIKIASGSSSPGCDETSSCYQPNQFRTGKGSAIIWYNSDSAAHTITSGTPSGGPDGRFDSGLIMGSTTYQTTINDDGTFPYFCMVHPWMTGYVIVERGGQITPAPTPQTVKTINVIEKKLVTLISDTFSSSATYKWEQLEGEPVKLSSYTSAQPSFMPPDVADGTTKSLLFKLTVNDPYKGLVTYLLNIVVNPIPETNNVTLNILTNLLTYRIGDKVQITAQLSGVDSENVAISVSDPSGNNLVSRTITTSSGIGSLEFKLSDAAMTGTYQIIATASINGNNLSETSSFSVESSNGKISVVSLTPTDQQGNTISTFTKGKMGFVKIVLSASAPQQSLVTVNLFDSDLTSLGIGSFKTTLGGGQSEMLLSFFIPNDAKIGQGNIYANVFTDWPSQGGTPLTGEASTSVSIK